MSGFMAYQFTDAQLVAIRKYCGFPTRSDGTVIFPAPWVNIQYLALEYRLQHISADEAAIVLTYLDQLQTLEAAIPSFAAQVNISVAAVYTQNAKMMRDANQAYDDWRVRLCDFLGIQPGPFLQGRGGSTMALQV